jgi:hypothetical protein
MNLPYQAPSIDREDSIGSAVSGDVAPAFWGAIASALAPVAVKAIRKLF